MNKLHLRGLAGHAWYNFNELLVQGILLKPVPKNLVYRKKIKYGEGKLQYINSYKNISSTNKKRPLLIYIHGGSWVSGITEMRNSYLAEWATKGFNTAAISYTYSPEKIFPGQLQEIFSAIDYIVENVSDFEVDLNNVILAGESAGGYFVSFVAEALTNKDCIKNLGIEFKHSGDINVKAMVTLSGCFDLSRLSDKKYPQAHYPDLKMMYSTFLGKDAITAKNILQSKDGKKYSPCVNSHFPPAFLVWGDKDILRYESFDFAKELAEHSIPHRLYKADGIIGMHAWTIVPLFSKAIDCFNATFDFVTTFLD